MCGICGQVTFDSTEQADPRLVKSMMDAMYHRGPDDEGMYVGQGAVLGHRRLSIIDLNRGKQPIANENQTIWVVFNGEIYNFPELRRDLAARGHIFRTDTDTEVIVHLYEEYGEGCLGKLTGMFAFAVWDEKNRKLFLARDRVGIKPVYYSLNSRRLLFASEIKALLADPSVSRDVDLASIDHFLTFMYLPGARTLLRQVVKLEPGHCLVAQDGKVSIRQYWDLEFDGQAKDLDIDTLTGKLVELLRATVRDHMISDVPVGVLLSGGVDSTGLLSFVAEESRQPVETFTVGFGEGTVTDERPFARLAAEKFESRHHEVTISPKDFVAFLPQYVWYMEEPICEPPAVALYYVSKLASRHVKVLISGEGGDEAFAGYQNYRNIMWLERAKQLGWPVTRGLAGVVGAIGRAAGVKRAKKYSVLMKTPIEDYYYGRTWNPLSSFQRLQLCTRPERRWPSAGSAVLIKELFNKVAQENTLNRMLYVDSKTWLPDDLLVKADKMTMANSVELRVPFLDHRVLEFAAHLPENTKVRGFTTKYILKKAFEGRVPGKILNRPKTGFPVPYEKWLQEDLRGPVSDILRDRRTVERGYFDAAAVEGLLVDSAIRTASAAEIFSLVTMELWHRQFVDARN